MSNIKKSDTQFTKQQILNKINNWDLEPFTQDELNLLLNHFNSETETYTYGQDDIESFILETLSEIEY